MQIKHTLQIDTPIKSRGRGITLPDSWSSMCCTFICWTIQSQIGPPGHYYLLHVKICPWLLPLFSWKCQCHPQIFRQFWSALVAINLGIFRAEDVSAAKQFPQKQQSWMSLSSYFWLEPNQQKHVRLFIDKIIIMWSKEQ